MSTVVARPHIISAMGVLHVGESGVRAERIPAYLVDKICRPKAVRRPHRDAVADIVADYRLALIQVSAAGRLAKWEMRVLRLL